jgi:hypothetical protein
MIRALLALTLLVLITAALQIEAALRTGYVLSSSCGFCH